MALFNQAFSVADNPRDKSGDCLNHHDGSNFSPVEHVIANRDHAHIGTDFGILDHALVDALVATAGKNDSLHICELVRHRLLKNFAGR